MEGTFGSDGELKKTGPSDVQTAQGLGGSNIKGVNDSKTRTDAEADTGKTVSDQHINSSNTYPRVGTDPASMLPATPRRQCVFLFASKTMCTPSKLSHPV